MNLHKFIRRICAAAVASALTLSLCTPVLAEGTAALPAAEPGTSQLDETGGIPIDPAHFPDENFCDRVAFYCDKDDDGTLSQDELNGVTVLIIDHAYIKDLTGIELFPNLEKLDCKNNNLTCLDVSKNTKLTVLYCEYNHLTSLDLSKNTELTELNCHDNQLTSLDLSKNTALTKLDCALNPLTSLDVSNNPALTYLNCNYNQLTSLDLRKNTALTKLGCESNQLTSLDLSQNTALTILGCSGNKRQITVDKTGQFDLSQLDGFDVSKASGWSEGAAVDGKILTVPYGVTEISYQYDLGNRKRETFTLTFDKVEEPDLPDDSSAPADTGSTAGGAIAAVAVGGAAVWGGYELVTRVMLHSLLPEGAAIPASRGQLALLVWNTAGRPEPAAAPAFADVADADTAKAAQWCAEQGYLDAKTESTFKPDGLVTKVKVIEVWNAAFPKN